VDAFMPLFEMTGVSLKPVAGLTFTEMGWAERANIQKAIRADINAITPSEATMVIAEEFGDWVGANRRIDLLCLDKKARLVVVELKREGAAHMELQAIRYAAMISTMRFDQAVRAHAKYLESIESPLDAEESIREFLNQDEGPVVFSDAVRIVLAASEFHAELTTAVLWLNKSGLDIRCVQLRPHLVDDRVLVDIQQVIPLPEAANYQVAVREKAMDQDAARASERNMTRYDLTIGDTIQTNLPKRRLIYEMVAEGFRRGLSFEQIANAVPGRESMFLSADGNLNEQEFFDVHSDKALFRYFCGKSELFHVGDMTYCMSNQWGIRTIEGVAALREIMPPGAEIEYEPTLKTSKEVSYEGYVILQRENGSIELERNGLPVVPVLPRLRELAKVLDVPTRRSNGNDLNTQTLGRHIIQAIEAL
jgi:hypothetical protein